MASKRMLKKSINNLTYELVSECLTYRQFHPEHRAGIDDIIQDVVLTRNNLIARVNDAPKEKEGLSSYYQGIVSEMQGMVSTLDKIETFK